LTPKFNAIFPGARFFRAHDLVRKPVSIPDQVEDILFGIMRVVRLVAAKFSEDSLQIGSLASCRGYGLLAMKFAVPRAFGHSASPAQKAFRYHVEA
jgi:hypothetical protein